MTAADLIYDALLRAEQRTEDAAKDAGPAQKDQMVAVWLAVSVIRQEIGNGLAAERI